jgi:hypothetical protein
MISLKEKRGSWPAQSLTGQTLVLTVCSTYNIQERTQREYYVKKLLLHLFKQIGFNMTQAF